MGGGEWEGRGAYRTPVAKITIQGDIGGGGGANAFSLDISLITCQLEIAAKANLKTLVRVTDVRFCLKIIQNVFPVLL